MEGIDRRLEERRQREEGERGGGETIYFGRTQKRSEIEC